MVETMQVLYSFISKQEKKYVWKMQKWAKMRALLFFLMFTILRWE